MPSARGAWLVGRHYAHRMGDRGFCAKEVRRFMQRHGIVLYSNALWRYDARLRVWNVMWPKHSSGGR